MYPSLTRLTNTVKVKIHTFLFKCNYYGSYSMVGLTCIPHLMFVNALQLACYLLSRLPTESGHFSGQ